MPPSSWSSVSKAPDNLHIGMFEGDLSIMYAKHTNMQVVRRFRDRNHEDWWHTSLGTFKHTNMQVVMPLETEDHDGPLSLKRLTTCILVGLQSDHEDVCHQSSWSSVSKAPDNLHIGMFRESDHEDVCHQSLWSSVSKHDQYASCQAL